MARVLITGCNSGFGLGAARMFAERGDRVYATVRDSERAEELTALADGGLPITILEFDVRDAARAGEIVAQVLDEGGIDALVNNAGVSMFAAVEEVSVDRVKEMMEVNLYGPLRLIQLVLPTMRRQRRGRIVNVSSGAGLVPIGYMSTYSMTKHALDALSFCTAVEVAPYGVKVSIVAPGAFGTAVGGKLWSPDIDVDAPEYRKTANALVAGWFTSVEGRHPDVVSQVIVDAVHAENPSIRILAGDDMLAIAKLRRDCTDDQWLDHMLPNDVWA